MTALTVDLTFASAKWKKCFPRMKQKIEAAATLACLEAKKPAALRKLDFQVNVILSTDAAIRKLNRAYRGKDKATNVLSFPQITPGDAIFAGALPTPLGDVVLAFETIRRECREQEKTLENHTIHLLVHGILHLFGYDHMNTKDAKAMERLECDILSALGYPDPYATQTEHGKKPRHGRRA